MRELIKDILKVVLSFLEKFPIITGILFLFIAIYLLKSTLPKAYNSDKNGVYAYYQKLSVILTLLLISGAIFIVQVYRVLN